MAGTDCDYCGESRTSVYYEGPKAPDSKPEDRLVGGWFCTVHHLVAWLQTNGFNVSMDNEPLPDPGRKIGIFSAVATAVVSLFLILIQRTASAMPIDMEGKSQSDIDGD